MGRFGFGRAFALNFAPVVNLTGEVSLHQALASKLKWIAYIHSFGAQFEPRYIFRAERLDQ